MSTDVTEETERCKFVFSSIYGRGINLKELNFKEYEKDNTPGRLRGGNHKILFVDETMR